MNNYPIFGGMDLDQIIWNYFPALPSVYDESLSYLEFLGNVLHNMNEERKHINSMGEAISLFQKYVLEELTKYDEKIITETKRLIDNYINDGTIAKLLNETLLKEINNKVNTKWSVYEGTSLPDIESREDNTVYIKYVDTPPLVSGNIKVSPNMQIRIEEM